MNSDGITKERQGEIEDRKIEILLEIVRTNDRYGETIARLESEYEELDAEHFRLRLEQIRTRGGG